MEIINQALNSKKRVFAPGCAMMLYKPELAEKMHTILNDNLGKIEMYNICCKHEPDFESETEVINICPGCDKRFRNDYVNTKTISVWEILAESDFFPFPDYKGKTMTIIDACPTRDQDRIHIAIRKLLEKMNILLVEPANTKTKSICCGDSFYEVIPTKQVEAQMKKRASDMPAEDVVVYCISCTKAMFIGGKKPHYVIDLLFGEDTIHKTLDLDEWHKELDEYIEKH
jgi:Fe-S oxidoreductase